MIEEYRHQLFIFQICS